MLLLAFVPIAGITLSWPIGAILTALGIYQLTASRLPPVAKKIGPWAVSAVPILIVGLLLTEHWLPLGPEKGILRNIIFVGGFIGGLLTLF